MNSWGDNVSHSFLFRHLFYGWQREGHAFDSEIVVTASSRSFILHPFVRSVSVLRASNDLCSTTLKSSSQVKIARKSHSQKSMKPAFHVPGGSSGDSCAASRDEAHVSEQAHRMKHAWKV